MTCIRFPFSLAVVCALVSSPAYSAPREKVDVIKSTNRYKVKGKLADSLDISGAAFVASGRALIAGDEGGPASLVKINPTKHTITVIDQFPIDVAGTSELDAEAIAISGRSAFLVGSHGLARKTMERQESRYRVARLELDDAGRVVGRPIFFSLAGALQASSLTAPYYDEKLQNDGVNIEGAAVWNGEMYLGLRSPNREGNLVVLVTTLQGKLIHDWELPMRPGYGIRAIEETPDGLLLLVGGSDPDADPKEIPSLVLQWDGKSRSTKQLGIISSTKGKPEAMLYLGTSDRHHDVMIFSDSVKDGDPRHYRLPRSSTSAIWR